MLGYFCTGWLRLRKGIEIEQSMETGTHKIHKFVFVLVQNKIHTTGELTTHMR